MTGASSTQSAPIVIAVGGNSLLDPDQVPTVANQFEVTAAAMAPVAEIMARGKQIALTHGNGPQVGFLQLRSELAQDSIHQVPLDSLVADTQGAMGYMIERGLRSELRKRGLEHPVVSIVTEVEVDADDTAFSEPNKPIGSFYEEAEAKALAAEHNWSLMHDPHSGYRRVVPSPAPKHIMQQGTIDKLIDLGVTVICCGGGGIPVSRGSDGSFRGEEAVIDKDRVSALLAVHLEAETFVITTGVKNVFENFYSDNPIAHTELSVDQVNAMEADGQFAAGSMAPKMEAALSYLEAIDGSVVICLPEDLVAALDGEAGTRIHR